MIQTSRSPITSRMTAGLIGLFMASLSVASCDKDGYRPCIRGNGDITQDTRTLSEFDGIDYRLTGKVNIIFGDMYEATVKGHANHIEKVRTRIQDGLLIIDSDRCLKQEDFQVDVTLPYISHIQIQGSADAEIEEGFVSDALYLGISGSGTLVAPVDADQITARISGSGDIVVRGTSTKLRAEISGSGKIKGFDLLTRHLNADISGSGTIESTVAERIDATISGSGSIRYKGNPSTVNTDVSGSGSVIQVN